MMRALNNEKGIALITTLMFLGLGLAVVAILLRFVTVETKMARLEQSYTVALDAAKGGTDMFMFLVQNGFNAPPAGTGTPINAGHCLHVKMNNDTATWMGQAEWTGNGCTNNPALAIDPNPTVQPDFTLSLSNYNVFVKVIDTALTQPPAPVSPAPSPTPPCYNGGCAYYTVNVRAVAPASNEHADISFVYRYDR